MSSTSPQDQGLTRELLLAGGLREHIQRTSPEMRVLTDEERAESLAALLADRPEHGDGGGAGGGKTPARAGCGGGAALTGEIDPKLDEAAEPRTARACDAGIAHAAVVAHVPVTEPERRLGVGIAGDDAASAEK